MSVDASKAAYDLVCGGSEDVSKIVGATANHRKAAAEYR